MRPAFCILLSTSLIIAACQGGGQDAGEGADAADRPEDAAGSYAIDPESGEITASHTDASGVTTTMRSGEKVEARLPKPFTVYPGARITNTTRVDQGAGAFVTVEFITPDPRDAVVEFYRSQAQEAGIPADIEVSGGETTTLGGERPARKSSFALQVTRVEDRTEGQISVSSGFE